MQTYYWLELVFRLSAAKVDPGLGLLRIRSVDDGAADHDAVNSATPISFCTPAQRLLLQRGEIQTPFLIIRLLRSDSRPQSVRRLRRSPLSAHRAAAWMKNHSW